MPKMAQKNCKRTYAMDMYLGRCGLCRKLLVKDGTCLFRAVSDSLCGTQAFHDRVAYHCREYIRRHHEELELDVAWSLGLKCLPYAVEMLALSYLYGVEFYVFHMVGLPAQKVTERGHFKKFKIWLTLSDNENYDLVHPRAYIQELAICQAILYEVLYKEVFKLGTEVEDAIAFIRQKKHAHCNYTPHLDTYPGRLDITGRIVSPSEFFQRVSTENDLAGQPVVEHSSPPLPYRICKALDPGIYRNVEFDIVQEEKRGQTHSLRHALQSTGFFDFLAGDKCVVQLGQNDDTVYHAHIQEISEPNSPVVVFIIELGEKRTVPFSSLRALPYPAGSQGSVTSLSDRSTRRQRGQIISCSMPGSSEFQPPRNTVRSPLLPVSSWNSAVVSTSVGECAPPVVEEVDTAQGVEYCMVSSSMPVINSTQITTYANSAGVAQGGTVYHWPLVQVPYTNSMGQVNLSWAPSQDPGGKDLPLSDMSTLRYFFNLGVEYFRQSTRMLQQQQQPVLYSRWTCLRP